jgi:hypothetical protein
MLRSRRFLRVTQILLGVSCPGLISCSQDAADAEQADAVEQPDSARWTAKTAWRLSREPVLEIKGSEDAVEEAPLDPVRVFRLADGRYVVGDGDQAGWHALMVYSAQGKFIAQWGREGRGPGEFAQLFTWAGVYRGDSIAAYDFVDRALEIFTSDGEFVRSLTLPGTTVSGSPPRGTYGASNFLIGPFRDGRVLSFDRTFLKIPDREGPLYYVPNLKMYNPDDSTSTTLAALPTWGYWWDGKKADEHPFLAAAFTAVGSEVWYHGIANDFSIRVFDQDGRVLRTLRRAFSRERVTPEDKEAYITWNTGLYRGGREGSNALAERVEKKLRTETRFAEYKPVYSNLIEDAEGNLWVEHFRWFGDSQAPTPGPTRWTIFDKSGQFLGEVEVPAAFIISSITNDQVLGFWQDEFDVEHVRIYALIKP